MPFIAMEMLPGADLEALLRSGEDAAARRAARHRRPGLPRPRLRATSTGSSTATSSRSNVRLLDDGTAKIMDFGIAEARGPTITSPRPG